MGKLNVIFDEAKDMESVVISTSIWELPSIANITEPYVYFSRTMITEGILIMGHKPLEDILYMEKIPKDMMLYRTSFSPEFPTIANIFGSGDCGIDMFVPINYPLKKSMYSSFAYAIIKVLRNRGISAYKDGPFIKYDNKKDIFTKKCSGVSGIPMGNVINYKGSLETTSRIDMINSLYKTSQSCYNVKTSNDATSSLGGIGEFGIIFNDINILTELVVEMANHMELECNITSYNEQDLVFLQNLANKRINNNDWIYNGIE